MKIPIGLRVEYTKTYGEVVRLQDYKVMLGQRNDLLERLRDLQICLGYFQATRLSDNDTMRHDAAVMLTLSQERTDRLLKVYERVTT